MALVTTVVIREISRMARQADTADIDQWWERQQDSATGVVASGHAAATQLALRYLREHAALERRTVEPATVEFDRDRTAEALRVTGQVAFKQHMRISGDPVPSLRVMGRRLVGSANRLVLAGARETTMATVASNDSIVGYRRVTSAGACEFCTMLASRGAVYKTDRSAGGRAAGRKFHDHCSCSVEPAYE